MPHDRSARSVVADRDQLCLQLEAIPADKTIVEDQAKLLGPLSVEENLAPEQLERALRFSRNTGLPLDQIVVAEFPHLRRPIGQIFVDLGFITPDDREAALTVQQENGGLLGEILITQGKITRLELANALSEHWDSATGARDTTANPSAIAHRVPRGDESSRRIEPSDAAELRRLLAELEAARVAAVQAAEAGLRAIDEALAALTEARAAEAETTRIANDELRERLDELIARRAAEPRDKPGRTQPSGTRRNGSQPHRTDPGRRPGRARHQGRRPRPPARRLDARGQQEALEAREGQEEALTTQASTIAERRGQGPRRQR